MTHSIRVIPDSTKLLEIESAWSTLINKSSGNPFFLSGFVKEFMEFYQSEGCDPLVLAILADRTIVGVASLMRKKKFGVSFAKFLHNNWFSPDFIVNARYRETFIEQTLDFLFTTLRCQFLDLTLPADSPNLRILKQKCKASRINLWAQPDMGHCVIPVKCTWDEFKSSRGKNFRRKFKKIERNLDQAGSWKIICVENVDEGSDAFRKILDVERMSWKEEWRTQRNVREDQDLLMIWKGTQYSYGTEPNFTWRVWFLELNDQTLAYCLVLQYKEVAFIAKTSYDKRYRRFYPGVYTINAAIREMFNTSQVRNIDFLADLSFHRTWTSLCLPRVRVMMFRKGPIQNLMGFVLASAYTKNVRSSASIILGPLLPRALFL